MPKKIRNLNLSASAGGSTTGPLLSNVAIENRIYDLLIGYQTAKAEPNGGKIFPASHIAPSAALQFVQDTDFGLRRLKKATIEKCIENVLRSMILNERQSSLVGQEKVPESINIDSDVEEDAALNDAYMVVKNQNMLNRGIVGLWATPQQQQKQELDISEVQTSNSGDTNAVNANDPTVLITTADQLAGNIIESSAQPRAHSVKKRERQIMSESKSSKRSKPSFNDTSDDRSPPTNIKLSDIGGMDHIVAEMLELVGMPILHPEIYVHTGIHPPRGVLLHGPPGCGKTMLANAIAGELGVPFISLSAPSIVSGMSGESEKRVREIFDEARSLAPCLIFLDEIDAITPKRESAQREMERRIVAQLLTCMDDLSLDKTDGKVVMIIGATNRPDSLDAALRRAGRFDREIQMNVPDEISRESILRVLSRKLRLSGDFDFKTLAKMTSGFVGADLNALTTAAGTAAIKRIFQDLKVLNVCHPEESEELCIRVNEDIAETKGDINIDAMDMDMDVTNPVAPMESGDELSKRQIAQHAQERKEISIIQRFLKNFPDKLTDEQLEPLSITLDDFLQAFPHVQPSSKREGFATIPDVTWADVGALERVRVELQMAIVQPIKRPELYAQVGVSAPAGVLLWGPPGCGKTLLAKAVANESRANFISVRGPELLNKWVGESERAVRQVFLRARASVPCVIFFDELDALVPRRDDSLSESSSRVVNTLLTELDGLNDRKGIYVIAATNRPDIIDPAMLRPGRLDKPLFVELPVVEERASILRTIVSRGTPIDDSVNIDKLAADERCRNFSGADLAALVREAAVGALRKAVFRSNSITGVEETNDIATHGKINVSIEDFEMAFANVKPSVSDKDRAKYERLGRDFGWKRQD
ncbi:P-loop containing nucleoside triphosphate hydrolase protein [Dipodascopsis uninucleata]